MTIARRPIASIAQVDGLQADLDAKVVLQGTDNGGQIPYRPRVPTFSVDRVFPNERNFGRVVLGLGDYVQAVGPDRRVRDSSDAGWIGWWERSGPNAPTVVVGYRGCYMAGTAATTRLSVVNGSPNAIYRSTDSGKTWTSAHEFRAGTEVLTSQSWCRDTTTGYLYYGEYQAADTLADINIYRSTDDGATWGIFHTFAGPGTTDPARVRHIHACQYDPVSERVYFTAGDSSPYAGGIYRVDDAGTGVEAVVLNATVVAQFGVDGYPIGLMFFDTHIAWGADKAVYSFVYRVARTEIGEASPAIERIYLLSGTAWCTARALEDNSVWLVTTTTEFGLDECNHIYAVSDNGASVYELGSVPAYDQTYSPIMPAGPPEQQGVGGAVWFNTRDTRTPYFSFRGIYGRSTQPLVVPPERRRLYKQHDVCSGQVTIEAGAVHYFGAIRAPSTAPGFAYIGGTISRFAGSGQVRCEPWNMTTDTAMSGGAQTDNAATVKSFGDDESSFGNWLFPEYRYLVTCAAGDLIGFRIRHQAGTEAVTCAGQVCYAWATSGSL